MWRSISVIFWDRSISPWNIGWALRDNRTKQCNLGHFSYIKYVFDFWSDLWSIVIWVRRINGESWIILLYFVLPSTFMLICANFWGIIIFLLNQNGKNISREWVATKRNIVHAWGDRETKISEPSAWKINWHFAQFQWKVATNHRKGSQQRQWR